LENLIFDVRSADMAKIEVGLTATESSWRNIQEAIEEERKKAEGEERYVWVTWC